ncbi:HutD family protein, partial [Cupriavidus basilensis]
MSDALEGMHGMERFSLGALAPQPWKNGGGVTREIAAWPEGAGMGDFQWRVSVADIAADGPFSAFPGIDRQIVLLEGAGVRLQADDGSFDHRLDTVGAPFAFAGERGVQATLLDGT